MADACVRHIRACMSFRAKRNSKRSFTSHPSVLLRAIRGCFLFLVISVAGASASDLSIVRVFTGWRDAASFKRISEYFNGRENTGGQIVLRTHPEQRGGYYFLVRVANRGAPVEATLSLQIVLPGGEKPRIVTFPTTIPGRQTVFDVGLTGPDWPGPNINPVAWKLDVLGANGSLLATDKSYLWSQLTEK
jgi:hypothetical protein